AMRGVSPGSSQKLLMALGIERKHTGNTDGLNKEVLVKHLFVSRFTVIGSPLRCYVCERRFGF
ncbi:MAG: hypothetical protein RR249_07515, partial [Tannerellaceae bacterium]